MSTYAWVTLATNDLYSLGALVLAYSLKRVSTAHQLAILITPTVSESMRNKLKDVFNVVQEVNVLDSQDAANLALLARPELGITFTKIHCWRLIQFEKCVFLDADTLVLQNCDELFEREELSAAPDVGWPDCFNSGVFVYRPSLDTFSKITQFALEKGSFDGGDQGLLNSYFSDWATSDISRHLPFLYNTCSTATYSYLPAFKQFADRIKILHFIGRMKPWLLNFNSQTRIVYTPQESGYLHPYLQFWWDLFCDNVHEKLTEDMPDFINQEESYNTLRIGNIPSNQNENRFTPFERDEIHTEVMFNVIIRDPWEDYYENLEKQIVSDIVNTEQTYNNNSNNENIRDKTPDNGNYVQNVDNIPHYIEENRNINTPYQSESSDNNNISSPISYPQQTESVPYSDSGYVDNRGTSEHSEEGQPEIVNNSDISAMSEPRLETQNLSDFGSTLQSEDVNIEKDQINNNNNNNANIETNNNSDKLAEGGIEGGLAGALSKLRLGEPRSPEQEAYEQHIRRQCWESGNIDYTGRDSFDNIWARISETLSSAPPKPAETPKEPGSM
ncbi:glycogenin-1 isoform X2 [Hermetia illucens]|uniref:glycogenin-1 isoform X2 n=1 Tax=Hermetia illucens TaxID=343691 RepID=UPI0018CC46A2|nr:glycogenin-1 isoform X2 [Hermetia illucens]